MKRFTRFFSSVLAALLTFTVLVAVTNAWEFDDVSATNPLLNEINYAVDNNFIEGTSSDTFSPNAYMTRGDMVLMLYRHSMDDEDRPDTSFTDVPSTSIYADAVDWAVYAGITSGTSSNAFVLDTNVRRQHAALMMYRYALHMGHRTDMTASLNNFTDISSVTNEEILAALSWAVGGGIMNGTSSTTLEPNSYITRGDAAAMLQRYGIKAERLNFARDTYSFTNAGANFHSNTIGKYFLVNADLEYLRQRAVANNVLPSTWDTFVTERINKEWNGSCYGMALTVMFDKIGHLNVNENRVSNAATIHDIGLPKDNLAFESMLNYYQTLQFLLGFAIPTTNIDLVEMMFEIKDVVLNEGMCVIELHHNGITGNGNHAVVAHDVIVYNSNFFLIQVYDSNGLSEGIIKVDNRGSTPEIRFASAGENSEINLIGYLTLNDVLDMYGDFDLDGPYNDWDLYYLIGHVGLRSADPIVGDDVSTLYIETDSDFAVVNSDGERLIYDYETNSFSGNMELRRKAIAAHGADYDKLSYILTVEKSDEYTFISAGDETDCHVLTRTSYIGAKGTNIDRMVIAETGAIDIQGNAMEYDVAFNAGETEGITFKGIGTGDLSVTKANEKVNVSGDVSVLSAKVLSTGESATEMCSFGAELTVVPPTTENNLLK
ncbi:MAG: S-layer homology domain-containing protein [Clostridia bacterium]|nr:S-layer homology domain-containing protein [Clostridia bacterium]